MPHIQDAASRFAHGGEGGDQQIVERGALCQLLAEHGGLRGQFLIGKLLHARFQLVDRGDQRPHGLHIAFVLGAKNFGENIVNYHFSSTWNYGLLMRVRGVGVGRLAAEEFALMAPFDGIDGDKARHQAQRTAKWSGGQRGEREGRVGRRSKGKNGR